MSFTPAIPTLGVPMGAAPKPTLVLDLEGVAGQEVKLHEWLDSSDGSYYDFTIDWGDGTVERVNEDNFMSITHTYAADVPATVKARAIGKCRALGNYNGAGDDAYYGVNRWLVKCDVENASPIMTFKILFHMSTKLTDISERIFENTKWVASPGGFLNRCKSLIQIPFYTLIPLQFEKLRYCFYNSSKLIEVPPISMWNINGVLNPFMNCSALTSVWFLNVPNASLFSSLIGCVPNRPADQRGTIHLCRLPDPKYDTALMEVLPEHQELANAKNWDIVVDPIA